MSLVVGVSFGHLDSSKINRLLCHKPCVAPGHVPSVMKFCMLGPPDTSMGCENIMGPACTPMFRQRFCTRSTNCKLLWPRRPFHPSGWHGSAPFVQWACRIWTAGGRVTLQLPLTSVSTTPRWPRKLGKQKCANLGWLGPKTPLCPNVKRRSLMLFGTRNSKVTSLLRLKSMISPKPLRFAIGCSTGVLTVWQKWADMGAVPANPPTKVWVVRRCASSHGGRRGSAGSGSLCSTVFPPMESRCGLSCHSGFRDLVEDGDVEPNPGSSSSASSRRMPAKQLNRCNINVNGPPAICSVLRHLPESDVILCQETAFPSVKAWTLVRPWEWQHPTLGAVQLHHVPADPPALERVQRVLRESMRIYYFQQFLQWGRREAEECSQNGVTYLEARCTKAPKMCNSQKRFTVLAGGMISPAAISIMRGLDAPSMCPWCGEQQVPTLEHVAWQCTGPDEVRIQHHVQNIRISCPMQKRLGWSTLMAHDEQVLDWLCYVRKRFLDHRFRASPWARLTG